MGYLKILYATDIHATGRNLAGRLDNFPESILKKLDYIDDIIKEQNVSIVVIGGDLYEVSSVSDTYASAINKKIRKWEVPVYVVPGNHDMYGYSVKEIDGTSLGVMASTGLVELLTRESGSIDFRVGRHCVSIEGQEYYAEIDTGVNDDYRVESSADFKILVAHSFLVKDPYRDDVAHTMTKDVVTNADMVLSGHYHPGYEYHTIDNTIFYNQGSLGRIERNKHNRDYIPQVFVATFTEDEYLNLKYEYETIQLPVPKSYEVLDYEAKEEKDEKIKDFDDFVEVVRKSDFKDVNIKNIIETVAKKKEIDDKYVKIAEEYFKDAERSLNKSNIFTKGYIESDVAKYIKKVTIHNYQSHFDTVVEFDSKFNIIGGESNNGKTVILRAIGWCLYNTPDGAEFITTGEKDCYVIVEFSDGSIIKRFRTNKKSAGGYEITTAAGEVKSFVTINESVMIEVYNIHQMPPLTLFENSKSGKTTEFLNILSQLDTHFMVGYGPTLKNALIGKLVGADPIDIAVKKIASEKSILSHKVTNIKEDIEGLENKLIKYNDLDKTKDMLDKAEEKLSIYSTLSNKTKELISLKEEKELMESKITIIENQVKDNIDIEKLSDLNNKYEGTIKGLSNVIELSNEYNSMNEKITKLNKVKINIDFKTADNTLNKLSKTIGEVEVLNNYKQDLKELQNKIDFLEKAKICDIKLLSKSLETYNSLIKEVELLINIKDKVISINSNINEYEDKNEKYAENINKCNIAMEKIKAAIKVKFPNIECPTCGTLLDENHIEKMFMER